MKLTTFQLRRLIREIIQEIGELNNYKAYLINKISPFEYEFKIDDNNNGAVSFETFIHDEQDVKFVQSLNNSGHWAKLYNVEYNINGSTDVGTINVTQETYNRILFTVLQIITTFINDNTPDALFIGSLTGKIQKHFNAIIAHNIEKLEGWKFTISKYGIMLYQESIR